MKRPFTVFGWLLIGVGWAALAAGWAGVQGTSTVAVQMAYLASGGLVGMALVAMGTGMQSQDDTRVVREILEELRERFDDLDNAVAELAAERPAPRRARSA